MSGNNNGWQDSKTLAKGILHDRSQRRRGLAHVLFCIFGMMAAGLWIIDEWLASSPWYFLAWWLVCGLLTCGVMVFALYDMLAVLREERGSRSGDRKR